MPSESSKWVETIVESRILEVVVPPSSFKALVTAGRAEDAEQAKGNLGARLWEGDSPIDFATDDEGGFSVLARDAQSTAMHDALIRSGIRHLETSVGDLAHGLSSPRGAYARLLDRKLRLTWKKAADSQDPAPHALDIFEGRNGCLLAVLTIKKPQGNQTMRVDLPDGTTVQELADDWKDIWSSNEPPTNVDGVFHHVRYHQLRSGKFIIWKVNHVNDAPDDECYIADSVPTMEEAFKK